MVYYHLAIFLPQARRARAADGFGNGYSFGADFYPIWLTARQGLLHHSDPYTPDMTRQIQIGLFVRSVSESDIDAVDTLVSPNYRAFSYPAFVDILFWPVALLPFSVVRIALAPLLSILTAGSIPFWLRAFQLRARAPTLVFLALLALSSYAVLEGLYAEQLGLLVAFLLTASLGALARGRIFLSGSLFALTFIKPQMVVLIAAYLFLWCVCDWRVRRRFVGGFFLMAVPLVVSSLLVWPAWISEWLRVLFAYREYSTPPLTWYLLGNRIGPRLGACLIAVFLLFALAIMLRARRADVSSLQFTLTVSLLLAITAVTLLPGHAVYDHVVLLPGIILIAFSWRKFALPSRPFRIVLALAALALFWQWILAPVMVFARLISSVPLSRNVIALPIRTAASIPFAVLALLALMLWRLHGKGLALENRFSREKLKSSALEDRI